jgi:hypothetical protein
MRKFILAVLALGSLTFVADDAGAKQISVTLSQAQVSAVCDGKNFCEKTCGSSGQYTCTFGCGSKSCSGQCANCPTGRTLSSSISNVLKNFGGALSSAARSAREAPTPPPGQTTVRPNNLTSTGRDISGGQATGRRAHEPVR